MCNCSTWLADVCLIPTNFSLQTEHMYAHAVSPGTILEVGPSSSWQHFLLGHLLLPHLQPPQHICAFLRHRVCFVSHTCPGRNDSTPTGTSFLLHPLIYSRREFQVFYFLTFFSLKSPAKIIFSFLGILSILC